MMCCPTVLVVDLATLIASRLFRLDSVGEAVSDSDTIKRLDQRKVEAGAICTLFRSDPGPIVWLRGTAMRGNGRDMIASCLIVVR